MDQLPKNAFALLRQTARPFKWKLILFFALTLCGITMWAGSSFVIRQLVNELVDSGTATRTAWGLVGLFVLTRFCDEWFWRLGEYSMRSTKPYMIERVRSSLFDYTFRKHYNFFVNSSSGQLGHWINQTTNTVNEVVDNTIWGVWPQAMGMLLSAFFLFISNWVLALIFSMWLILLFTFTIKRGKHFGKLVEVESESRSQASGLVVDALANHMSVRVFNARNRELERLSKQQDDIISKWRTSWGYHIVTNAVKGNSIPIIGALSLSTMLLLFNSKSISVGDVTLFIAYFTAASSAVWELSWQLDLYYRSFGTIDNAINGLSKGETERTTGDTPIKLSSHDITMRNLEFHYPDQPNKPVLENINLHLKQGEHVGLVGHSGAGKTTLVGLLLGFYEPTGGDYEIGGANVSSISPDQLRDLITYVPQDTNLFNRTVRENLAYARKNATDKQIRQASKEAQALEFIEQLPEKFDTMIGERGVKLSGGQRQRMAIARALLKNTPIVLLDEATSALDSVSEQAIQKALSTAMKGRTALVVAHRLSTLRHLDRIVVFDGGKIAEEGTHDELIKLGGIYADLWRRQKDGFIAD